MNYRPVLSKLLATIYTFIFLFSCESPNSIINLDDGSYLNTINNEGKFTNPIIKVSLPDPSIIKGGNNTFYLYATEDTRNVPIYKSNDLINWKYIGTVFTEETRPNFVNNGTIWAPDINLINDKYVLYYSQSVWGGEWTCGIGVAFSYNPEGPFINLGKLFTSKEINVQNSIDPFFIKDNGRNYLFWGSNHGIYGIELSEDGFSLKEGETPKKIAGNIMEGTYIHKYGDYYYLIGSNGSCCNGNFSTYKLIVGRSTNLWGPYLNKDGKNMIDGGYSILLKGNDFVAGPGHNAEIITDDNNNNWLIYHGYLKENPGLGRLLFMDNIIWKDGWPSIENDTPSLVSNKPKFK